MESYFEREKSTLDLYTKSTKIEVRNPQKEYLKSNIE